MYAERQWLAWLLAAACAMPLAANNNIGTTELIEANRKEVDKIYLSTIGKEIDTFPLSQRLPETPLLKS